MVEFRQRCFVGSSTIPFRKGSIMRVWLVAFAMSCEIPLMVAHRLFPNQTPFLPLGGDEFIQLMILMSMAWFFVDLRKFAAESLTVIIRTIRYWKKEKDEEQ
jgi:hypothetical protein